LYYLSIIRYRQPLQDAAHMITKIRSYIGIFEQSARPLLRSAAGRGLSPVARQLIVLDFIFAGSLGLWLPIFALFLEHSIVKATPFVIGTAVALFFLGKRIMQREAPEFLGGLGDRANAALFPLSAAIALAPLAYLLIHSAIVLLVFQVIYGALCAFAFPIFALVCAERADAQNRELWESYYSFNDIGAVVFGIAGGLVATYAGFDFLIGLMVTLSVVAVLFLFPLYPYLHRR
jgi:MFS family permease